jgi:predicted nucleic-acid-binding protein
MSAPAGHLDTSLLVRYLTGIPEDQARIAKETIEAGEQLLVSEVAIAEAAHVLQVFYRLDRSAVASSLQALLERENIQPVAAEKDLLIRGLELTKPSGRVSIAGALIWSIARSRPPAHVFTFDRRFPLEGVTVTGIEQP